MISVCDIATVFKFITIMKTKNIIEKKKTYMRGVGEGGSMGRSRNGTKMGKVRGGPIWFLSSQLHFPSD